MNGPDRIKISEIINYTEFLGLDSKFALTVIMAIDAHWYGIWKDTNNSRKS